LGNSTKNHEFKPVEMNKDAVAVKIDFPDLEMTPANSTAQMQGEDAVVTAQGELR
jgi:hypothetical protein